MEMKRKVEIFALFLFVICGSLVSQDTTLEKDCANLLTKMTNCLPFASAKNDVPTKECCTSITEVKDSNPACLCFFIQQIHKGDTTLKGLGIQEARLLQLPAVCKLTNASITECPRLLKLPANSPDAVIFKNASNSSSSTPAAPLSSTTPTTTSGSGPGTSNAFKNSPELAGAVALAIVFLSVFAFSSGVVFLHD